MTRQNIYLRMKISVSSNVRKGIIMLKQNNKYIVDIYIDNGIDNIANGLLNICMKDYEMAKKEYAKYLTYLNTNN